MKNILFLLLFLPFMSHAQVPEPHMLSLKGIGGGGNDNFSSHVKKTNDGGFIIQLGTSAAANTGNVDSFCSFTNKRSIFLKYNEDGTVLDWYKCYGSNGDSGIVYLFPRNDGTNVVGGNFGSSNGWGCLLAKHDNDGNVIWQRNYSKGGGSVLKHMIETEDGGYLILSESHRTDTNVLVHYGSWSSFDIWVLKVDSNGYKQWSKVIGGSYDEGAIAVVPAPNNGCYILGTTQSSDYDCTGYHAGGQDAYLVRLDPNGNILWHRCLGGSGYEAGFNAGNIVSDNRGGVIIVVSTSSIDGDVSHHINETDIWMLDVDSSGNILWDKCYHNGNFEYPNSVCKATDGSIWISGWTYSNYYDDVFIVHTDSTGNLLQTKNMYSYNKDHGRFVYPLKDGIVLVGGTYYDHNESFSPLHNYGFLDVFLAVFAPWSVGINDIENDELLFKIYPNPAKGILYIEKQNNNTNTKISLMSIDGKQMIQTILASGNSRVEIDVSQYPKGSYWVRISSDTHKNISQKITIE